VEAYIADWLNLLLRFLHLVTGIAWIGASFYFIWLDNSLREPPEWKADKGIKGDLWAIHGGGFYEIAKYRLAPADLPVTLHWFKWEAYSTWITGILLLSLMYYLGAQTYLIDPVVAQLSPWQAIAIGLGVIIGGWVVYDNLCNTGLASNGTYLGIILVLLIAVLAFSLSQLFSARGAYIHVGAVIGTIMAGNVYRVIIPSQKALVTAVAQGSAPDPAWAIKAKLRSTHNTYATLPLLFIMISNHYPVTYNHQYNWAVLIALILITATARQYFVLRHNQVNKPLLLLATVLATVILAILIAPGSLTTANPSMSSPGQLETHAVDLQGVNPDADASILGAKIERSIELRGQQIIAARCASCHSDTPLDDQFTSAPAGVRLENLAHIQRWAPRIIARAVDTTDMPLLNKTHMTEAERDFLAIWLGDGFQQSLQK
jgi:uncharacterized membrane protein